MSFLEKLKEKYRRFCEWQKVPHHVKPMSQEEHECPTCGRHYVGNYCPQCGQSSRISRYSFKSAFLLFIDVWGLGNRGMFRTIRDLLLRPGYMIRDYLSGMQMAYFPPFKMFFLLIALSLIVNNGLNINLENHIEKQEKEYNEGLNRIIYDAFGLDDNENDQSVESLEALERSNKATEWTNKHLSLVTILLLLLYTIPLFMFFRKCPAYPGIRFSEFFVAMVYITNMITIYSLVTNFFCLNLLIDLSLYVLALIPLKQFSGYSYWRVIWNCIAAFLLFIIIGILIIFAVSIILTFASHFIHQ